MDKKSVVFNISSTMMFFIILMILNAIQSPIVARMMGVQGRGEFTAITAWPTIVATIGVIGLPDALLFYGSKKKGLELNLLITSWYILLPITGIVLLTAYFLMPTIMSSQTSNSIFYARIYLFTVPLVFLSITSLSIHKATNDFMRWNVLRVVKPFLYFIVIIVMWIAGKTNPGQVSILFLLSNFFGTIIILLSLSKYGNILYSKIEKPMIGSLRKFGFLSTMGTLPGMLNTRVDQLIMVAILDSVNLGLYTVAVSWSLFLSPIVNSITQVMFPYIAQSSENQIAYHRLSLTTRIGLIVTIFASSFLLILTPIGLPLLFGRDFSPAIPTTLILTVAAIFWQYNQLLETGLKGLGFPQAVFWAEGVALLATILLLFLLLPVYGILGAAIASLIAYSTSSLVLFVYTKLVIKEAVSPLFAIKIKDFHEIFYQFKKLLRINSSV